MDRVKPLKFESPDSGGTELDEFPTSLDPNEDVIDCHGIALQDTSSDDALVIIRRDENGNLTFTDANTPTKTLTQLASGQGMTPEDHRLLNQLTHILDCDYFEEYNYSNNMVSSIVTWDSAEKNRKIREEIYNYTGTKITSVIIKQYNNAGDVIEQLTEVYNYSGPRIVSVTVTRSVP